jgi:hypothetical protein
MSKIRLVVIDALPKVMENIANIIKNIGIRFVLLALRNGDEPSPK